jgi:hypothetical protein
LEIYKLLRAALGVSDLDMSNNKVDTMVDKGAKLIEEKLYKNDAQVLQGLIKNIGVAVVRNMSKNLLAKMIPIIGIASGAFVCITEDYKLIKSLGKRTLRVYNS